MAARSSAPWRVPATRFLGSLGVRDFRWLWANNVGFSLGMSLEMLAQGWLVLTMTDSAFWVGVTAGVRGIGQVVVAPTGGILADRMNRRTILTVSQILRGLAVLAIGLLIVGGQIALWHMVALALIQGVLAGLSVPANNALVYDTVGRELLLNAMAARNAAFNLSRIAGGVLAGTIISLFGLGVCYLTVAGAFFVSLAALLFVRGGVPLARAQSESVWHNLIGGLAYASRSPSMRMLLLLSVLMETFGFSHQVMLPVVARDVLHVGPSGLGLLSTGGGIGAMVGTVVVAGLGDFRRKGRLLAVACSATALLLVLFAWSPWFIVSLALVALINATLWAYDSTLGAVLQLLSWEAMRGRVLGLYALTWGFTPVGGFVVGTLAAALGTPLALSVGALALLTYTAGTLRATFRLRETPEAALDPAER